MKKHDQHSEQTQPSLDNPSSKSGRTTQNREFDRTIEKTPLRPTVEGYQDLELAFDFFNHHLFKPLYNVELPHVMFTMPKNERMMGYFQSRSWTSKDDDQAQASEIALNPVFFCSSRDICQTLVHEMAHLAQDEYPEIFGKPGKRGYHNKAFAKTMFTLGLQTTSTGFPGGNKTGVKMSDYVISGEAFEKAYAVFQTHGHDIRWSLIVRNKNFGIGGNGTIAPGHELATQEDIERMRKRRSKTKYTCPTCKLNAWAKTGIRIGCLECSAVMQEQG